MIRLCNQCKCELNGENTAKKDARRYRKICRPCFREKRNKYRHVRSVRQGNLLDNLIDKEIVKVDPIIAAKVSHKSKEVYNGFLERIVTMIKNVIRER